MHFAQRLLNFADCFLIRRRYSRADFSHPAMPIQRAACGALGKPLHALIQLLVFASPNTSLVPDWLDAQQVPISIASSKSKAPGDTIGGQRTREIVHHNVVVSVADEQHRISAEHVYQKASGPTLSEVSPAKVYIRQHKVPSARKRAMDVDNTREVIAQWQGWSTVDIHRRTEKDAGSRFEVQIEIGSHQSHAFRRTEQSQQIMMQGIGCAASRREQLDGTFVNCYFAVLQLTKKAIQRTGRHSSRALSNITDQLPEAGQIRWRAH
jgi:hypothetical protein